MISEETISKSHVPESVLEQYSISEAYVAKLGFIRFELSQDFASNLATESGADHPIADHPIYEYIDELYSLLEKSPHVMEIAPTRQELKKESDLLRLGIKIWSNSEALSLSRFLSLRVVLPKRKREDMGIFPWSWNPEAFTILFDGALFVAYAPVDSVPVATELGQIARDFLAETLAPAKIWRSVSGFGPTPIHPQLYFVNTKRKTTEGVAPLQLPLVNKADTDLVIFIRAEDSLDIITEPLLQDMEFGLSYFYSQRIAQHKFDDAVDALAELDKQLNERVSQYFKISPLRCMFSGTSRSIRKLIAEMHTSLQRVSSAEIAMRRQSEEANRMISDSTFLKSLQPYFKEQMAPDTAFDREAELTNMNFAAKETSNFAITQATVIAALAGAVLGGLLAAIAQYLVN